MSEKPKTLGEYIRRDLLSRLDKCGSDGALKETEGPGWHVAVMNLNTCGACDYAIDWKLVVPWDKSPYGVTPMIDTEVRNSIRAAIWHVEWGEYQMCPPIIMSLAYSSEGIHLTLVVDLILRREQVTEHGK